MKIAVLGAGNAGLTIAAHLAMLDHEIYLYEDKNYYQNLKTINEDNYIQIDGIIKGKGRIFKTSLDMREIIIGVELIICAFPAYCQDVFFDELAKYVEKNQIVLIMPDNYGSIKLFEKLKFRGIENDVYIAGINSCLYACRKVNNNRVLIKGKKSNILLASINSSAIELCGSLNEIMGGFVPSDNIYEVCLSNINCVIHVASSILNTGWIESTNGGFDFYGQGITYSVSKIIGEIDKERILVGKKMNLNLDNIQTSLLKNYGIKYDNLFDALSKSTIHTGDFSPADMDTRYVTEDVPYGLVPISKLGQLHNVKTTTIDSIINLAEIIMKKV